MIIEYLERGIMNGQHGLPGPCVPARDVEDAPNWNLKPTQCCHLLACRLAAVVAMRMEEVTV
jgi:hypothetical protein